MGLDDLYRTYRSYWKRLNSGYTRKLYKRSYYAPATLRQYLMEAQL